MCASTWCCRGSGACTRSSRTGFPCWRAPEAAGMERTSLAVAWLVFGCVACTSDATREPAPPSALLGCHVVGGSRALPGRDSRRTSIVRQAADDTVGFVARHPAACGLRGRNPSFAMEAGVLQLRYDLQTQ